MSNEWVKFKNKKILLTFKTMIKSYSRQIQVFCNGENDCTFPQSCDKVLGKNVTQQLSVKVFASLG